MDDHAPSPERLRRIADALARLDLVIAGAGAEEIRWRAAVAAGDYLAPRAEARALTADIRKGRYADVGADRLIDVIASAAARRATWAARASAETWAEHSPELVDGAPHSYGPGDAAVDMGRDRLGFWLADLRSLAEQLSSRRMPKRWRRRVGDAVLAAVFDPGYVPGRHLQKRLDRILRLVEAARDRLHDEIEGILTSGSRRFVELLGQQPPQGVLAELSEGGL